MARQPEPDHLHIVLGGELQSLDGPLTFRDPAKVEFVGAFRNHAEAYAAWKAKAQATVDNALLRYLILNADRLLDPSLDLE